MTEEDLDSLLEDGFGKALHAAQETDITELVLARIRVRERLRLVALLTLGLLASVICVLSAVPLLEAGMSWLDQAFTEPTLQLLSPTVLVVSVGLAVLGGWLWLLLEEPI